ncbi:MAG: valine--tRNA ligase, partial [Lachnospiraceae bacterium]|nr:valine--tRNA ligase [Lachnospiraceae bacterium]
LFFASLASASAVDIQKDREGIAQDAVSVVTSAANIYIPFEDLVDVEKELERLEKEEQRLAGELKRVNSMLNNERFISKAPAAKIDEEKQKLEKYSHMMDEVRNRLEQLRAR